MEATRLVEIKVPEDLWPRRGGWTGRLVRAARPGDIVDKGSVVAEVEIEKAVLEIEAPVTGRVVWSLEEGSEVSPGTVLLRVEPLGGEAEDKG